MAEPRLTLKRLFGIDRSGPNPVATRPDQPLRPFTIPNAIGYTRLALVPVFLVVGLTSDTGRDWIAATLFAVIGAADYLDGFTARLTGQYSRMGALLDPIVDRTLVISGVVVMWDHSLLPRWALAIVVVRELVMLVLSRMSLHRGMEIKIIWAGRFAVPPTIGAPFFAMLGVHWLALIMLYIGLALALLATAFYIQRGLHELSQLSS